jgi:hypothetical protein
MYKRVKRGPLPIMSGLPDDIIGYIIAKFDFKTWIDVWEVLTQNKNVTDLEHNLNVVKIMTEHHIVSKLNFKIFIDANEEFITHEFFKHVTKLEIICINFDQLTKKKENQLIKALGCFENVKHLSIECKSPSKKYEYVNNGQFTRGYHKGGDSIICLDVINFISNIGVERKNQNFHMPNCIETLIIKNMGLSKPYKESRIQWSNDSIKPESILTLSFNIYSKLRSLTFEGTYGSILYVDTVDTVLEDYTAIQTCEISVFYEERGQNYQLYPYPPVKLQNIYIKNAKRNRVTTNRTYTTIPPPNYDCENFIVEDVLLIIQPLNNEPKHTIGTLRYINNTLAYEHETKWDIIIFSDANNLSINNIEIIYNNEHDEHDEHQNFIDGYKSFKEEMETNFPTTKVTIIDKIEEIEKIEEDDEDDETMIKITEK